MFKDMYKSKTHSIQTSSKYKILGLNSNNPKTYGARYLNITSPTTWDLHETNSTEHFIITGNTGFVGPIEKKQWLPDNNYRIVILYN